MFIGFADLPTELRVQIVKKFQSIPYVRLRRTCRFVNVFCEEHRKALGIYIYRKTPEIFLLNSLKNTYPFWKRMTDLDEDISDPHVVVEYGKFYGEANLKMPLNLETVEEVLEAVSGFNFPEVSVLNYGPEEDDLFAAAFDLFLEIVVSLRVDTINFKNVTMEQFSQLTSKWPNLKQIRLRTSKNNVDLINTELVKNLRQFSCCFADNFASATVNFSKLLKPKSIVTLDWSSNKFNWTALENIMMNYQSTIPEMYFYRLYLEETAQFFDLDLTTLTGGIIPADGFYVGSFKPQGTNFLEPEERDNQRNKFDYWVVKLEGVKKWREIVVTRKSWSFCADVCIVLDKMTDEEDLNMAFVDLVDEFLLPGTVLDYSVIYQQLEQLDTVEEKRAEAIGFVESIVAFYGD